MKHIHLLLCVQSLVVGLVCGLGESETSSVNENEKYSEMVEKALEWASEDLKKSNEKLANGYPKYTPATEEICQYTNKHILAYKQLKKDPEIPPPTVTNVLLASDPDEPEMCKRKEPNCDCNEKYRRIDGTCNNLAYPLWGSTFRPYCRFCPSQYEDGWNSPRGGRTNSSLPNPRLVSNLIHADSIDPDLIYTNMVPQLGQFLDHDCTLTPVASRTCCGSAEDNPDCFPIRIAADDEFYSKVSPPQNCMAFTRSTAFCFPQTHGIREQFNLLTSYVDGSQIYGADEERAKQLREWIGGRLVENSEHTGMLPTVAQIQNSTGQNSFFAGDQRVNQMPALTAIHTLWMREHNRLAGEIQARRPGWTDEKIYQETRRILIAVWQNVVYGQYLPCILGEKAMRRYKLKLGKKPSKYDRYVEAMICNAFSTAAYRFGHTLAPGVVEMKFGNQTLDSYHISLEFNDPKRIMQNETRGYDWILGGLMAQNCQKYDPAMTDDLRNHVLQRKGSDFGADLCARNIQRGRDHGLRNYNDFRLFCGLPSLGHTWGPTPEGIRPSAWEILPTLYKSPSEIDLFTGALCEDTVPGTVSGPTFNCLKARQFARLKFGDRFFFTHEGESCSFSPEQIKALKKVTLGDIICQNSKVEMTTKNVFNMPGEDNPWWSCSDPRRKYLNIEKFLE